MRPFVFYWELSTGMEWDSKLNRMNFDAPKHPKPMCGSDAVIRLDGRNTIERMKADAVELIATRLHKKQIIGYSIGELVCHDPNDVHSQCYVPLTLF